VIDAEKMGLKYGVKIVGVKFKPSYGLTHYQRCLEALALF